MKNFCIKLFLAGLPVYIYIILFIIYEPYNYFGLQESAVKSGYPLERVRAFMKAPSENIIIGDSRMTDFDLDYVEEISGKRYATLATGGQAPNLSKEMYQFASEFVEVKNIVMDVSFYQVRKNNCSVSAQPIFYIARHPLDYIVTRDYVVDAFLNMAEMWGNREITKAQSGLGIDGKYREDLVVYAKSNIYPMCENYTMGIEEVGMLSEIAQAVSERDGDVKVLIPVVQESIWEYVIDPLEFENQLFYYRQELSKYATVYDMEWKSKLSMRQDCFKDGFHFNSPEDYQIYIRNIFGETDDSVKVIEKNSRE